MGTGPEAYRWGWTFFLGPDMIMNDEYPRDAGRAVEAVNDLGDLRRLGRRVQWATVAWNLGEVFVTIGLGVAAGSLALIAFGLDWVVGAGFEPATFGL